MASHSKENIISTLNKIFDANNQNRDKDIRCLYQNKIINYTGYCKDQTLQIKILYQEIIAEYLITKLEDLKEMKSISREASYNRSHKGQSPDISSNREEERIAIEMFKYKIFNSFKIIDYQTPLKNKGTDKSVGKIDLLAYDESNKKLYLLELKRPKSSETLLRAVLEAYTYSKIVDQSKLKLNFGINNDTKIVPAVALFASSDAHKHYLRINIEKSDSKVIKLMKSLGVHFFSLSYNVCGQEKPLQQQD